MKPLIASGHYVKSIVRTFYRNRSYTLVNLLGLAAGFAVFILSSIYVYFETHFEDFHHNAGRIYRATYRYTPPGDYQTHWARIPFDYINALPQEVPGIKTLIRFQNHARKYVRVGKEKFKPAYAYVADKEVFDVFDFELLEGNPVSALAEPHAVVLSESLAATYFPGQNAIGQEIFVISDLDSAETLHHVTGVMKDLPAITHLPVDMLISFRNEAERSGWAYTYILLADGADITRIQSNMPSFVRKHSGEDQAKTDAIIFQPMRDIHLKSGLAREIVPNGNIFYVRVIGFAGILILIMAVINFTNLNSAMSLGRAKEIGMRKVMGVSRGQLISYLTAESVVSHVVALGIGACMAYILFPYLKAFITIQFLPGVWGFTALMISVAILLGMVSGIYPVILLTSLKPMAVLKSTRALTFAGKEKAFSLKRVMVTLQFVISILLIGSALVSYSQFRYLLTKNLGITREQVIAIPGVPDQVKEKFEAFRNRLEGQPGILEVGACMEVPSREIRDSGPVLIEGVNNDPSRAPIMDIQVIDHNFASLLKLEFVAGKNVRPPSPDRVLPKLSPEFDLQDYLFRQPREYLINETAMHQLGWTSPADAVGQKISWSIGNLRLAPGPVAGVVRDFHQESLRNSVDPIVMVQEPVWLRTFLIKVETQHIRQSVQKISHEWNDLFPFYPMEYFFLDDLYNNLYKGERTQVQLLFIFSGLAIGIAFLGLLALVAYALKTRTKEIAIRKVLGATVGNLIRLISREYLIVLIIAAAIAIPISIYGVSQWLSAFAYHVKISGAHYLIALAPIVLVLIFTVSTQTIRAANANPADTLRDE